MTVCRYFLQGNCRFGERCRFEHTDPYESNAYESPNRRNDYSYQDRSRQQSNYQDKNRQYDQNISFDQRRYKSSENYNQNRRYDASERYDQNERYSSGRPQNQKESYVRYNTNERDDSSTFDTSNHVESNYYANKYDRNKHAWMSDDYKKQLDQKTHRAGGDTSYNTSIPKSRTSFSFKDPGLTIRQAGPIDLYMNENNMVYAETIKEDVLLWELGNQWLFTCYCPMPEKQAFPGFDDLSPEELRLEAYRAKENNTYDSYVESVQKMAMDIKSKRNHMKEPSVQLMSIIETIRTSENLSSTCVVDGALTFGKFNQSPLEDMVADDSSVPPSSAAASFSFKTTLDTDTKSSASSFSFKLPPEKGPILSELVGGSDVYTPLDNLSVEDIEQFSASTFTLGKIPTMPPPQQLCF